MTVSQMNDTMSYAGGGGSPREALGVVVMADATAQGSLPPYEDQRVFDSLGYTVSTTIVSVVSGAFLVAELANPAGSGVNYVMTSRAFSHNVVGGNAPLEYDRYSATSVIATNPAPTVATINNRIAGGTVSTGTFRYNTPTTAPTGGAITSSGFIPTNGEELRIKEIVVIPPGSKLIYVIRGPGGALAAAVRAKMTFLFYTRPTNG